MLLVAWFVTVIRANSAPIVDCAPDTICRDMTVPHALLFGVVFAVPVLLVMAPTLGYLVGASWGGASLFFVHERPSITIFGATCLILLIVRLAGRYRFRTPVPRSSGPSRGYPVQPPRRLLRGPQIGLAAALLAAGFLISHYRTAVDETSAHLHRAVLVEGRVTQVGTDPMDPWVEVSLPDGTRTGPLDTSLDDHYAEGNTATVLTDPADPAWDRLGTEAPLNSWALWLVTACLALAGVMLGRWLAVRRFVHRLSTGSAPTQPVVVGFRLRAAYLHDFPPADGYPTGAFAALPHIGPQMIPGRHLPAAWTQLPETELARTASSPAHSAPGTPGIPLYGTPSPPESPSGRLPPYGYAVANDGQGTMPGGFSGERPAPWPPGPAPVVPWQETWGAALAPLVPAVFVGSLRPGGWGVLIAGDTIWWPRRPVRRLRRIPIWSRTHTPTVSSRVHPWPPAPASEPW